MTAIYGTAVAIHGHGVLLRGASGAGKSDLALRLVDRGALLIGDDWVEGERIGGEIILTAVPRLQGLIEVRGVGIVRLPYGSAPLVLVVDLGGPVERLPEPELTEILGVNRPRIALDARLASAPIQVELALHARAQALGR